MSLKEDFKFSNESKCWIYASFLLSNSQYENCEWETINTIINDFFENREYYVDEGKKALLGYASEIDFFSKEEFDDLVFDFGQARLLIKHQKPEGFRLAYSVKDDGTQKIHWKDLYGIWTVDFAGRTIRQVNRVEMIDFN